MKISNNPIAGKTLKQLVDRLVSDSLSNPGNDKNFIVNEVPENMCVLMDECKEGNVISELLTTVVTNARNGDIHITADQFRDIITVDIEERNNNNGYALASRLQHIEPEANRLGGSISIKGEQQLVTKISFSFPLLTVRNNTQPVYHHTYHYH
ncbi:MAG: hypothetical protein ABWZ25_05315 [Chitinophagaceae bacterium]